MPTTLNRAYPIPERTIAPDAQLDLQKLAEALDVDVAALYALFNTPSTGALARITAAETALSAIGRWQAYSPSVSGLGTGATVVSARYATTGPTTITGKVRIRIGTNVTGVVSIGLPSTVLGGAVGDALGVAYLNDNDVATGRRMGAFCLTAADGNTGFIVAANGNNVNPKNPFTWAADDIIAVEFTYERAAS